MYKHYRQTINPSMQGFEQTRHVHLNELLPRYVPTKRLHSGGNNLCSVPFTNENI